MTNRSASHRILPNPGSIPPYQASTIPATTADLQHSQMYAGSIVAIRFDGEAARRLMGPLVTGSAPGLTLDIAGRVAEVAYNGHLFVEANTESQSQDGKHYRSISVSGIVKPTDVGPNRQISAEKIASLRVEIRDSPKRSLGESRIDGTEK